MDEILSALVEAFEPQGGDEHEPGTHVEPVPITDANRDAWLSLRQSTLGASDAPDVCGMGWSSPVEIWQRKVGLAAPVQENEAMYWGREHEPAIARRYCRDRGCTLRQQLYCVHPKIPWMTVTLDAIRSGDGRIVEFKTAGAWSKEWGDEGSDQVPAPYLIQVTHQMIVTGTHVADLAVLIGGNRYREYTIARDPALVDAILNREADFWDCVVRKTPPWWGKRDAQFLARLNPGCAGETAIEAPDVLDAVLRYENAGGYLKDIERQRDEDRDRVLAALGNHQFGRLPDGRLLKRFLQEVPERMPTKPVRAHIKHYFLIVKGDSE